jgi:hypothetical protein
VLQKIVGPSPNKVQVRQPERRKSRRKRLICLFYAPSFPPIHEAHMVCRVISLSFQKKDARPATKEAGFKAHKRINQGRRKVSCDGAEGSSNHTHACGPREREMHYKVESKPHQTRRKVNICILGCISFFLNE